MNFYQLKKNYMDDKNGQVYCKMPHSISNGFLIVDWDRKPTSGR